MQAVVVVPMLLVLVLVPGAASLEMRMPASLGQVPPLEPQTLEITVVVPCLEMATQGSADVPVAIAFSPVPGAIVTGPDSLVLRVADCASANDATATGNYTVTLEGWLDPFAKLTLTPNATLPNGMLAWGRVGIQAAFLGRIEFEAPSTVEAWPGQAAPILLEVRNHSNGGVTVAFNIVSPTAKQLRDVATVGFVDRDNVFLARSVGAVANGTRTMYFRPDQEAWQQTSLRIVATPFYDYDNNHIQGRPEAVDIRVVRADGPLPVVASTTERAGDTAPFVLVGLAAASASVVRHRRPRP